jgi:hypothetical protein
VQSVTRGASSMNDDKSPSITAYETCRECRFGMPKNGKCNNPNCP